MMKSWGAFGAVSIVYIYIHHKGTRGREVNHANIKLEKNYQKLINNTRGTGVLIGNSIINKG